MRFFILFLCSAFWLISCNGEGKTSPDYTRSDSTAAPIAKFVTLDFESGGKFCTATINQNFTDFKNKQEFPFSLFITINTVDKNKDGTPTVKENLVFDSLEENILTQLATETRYCYVGRTRMDGYRDMMLYIPEKDQKRISEKLKSIQEKESRLKTYTFEKDPEWEAVSEFYEAVKAVKSKK